MRWVCSCHVVDTYTAIDWQDGNVDEVRLDQSTTVTADTWYGSVVHHHTTLPAAILPFNSTLCPVMFQQRAVEAKCEADAAAMLICIISLAL